MREAVTKAMGELARDKAVRFVGYNVLGNRAGGTLAGVPEGRCVEMPVAENLVAGAAIGMALAGLRPVVWIERFDFVLNALDQIVNHVDKMATLSAGEFAPVVLIRTAVGRTRSPLYTGPTHTQDFTNAIREMVRFPVVAPPTPESALEAWRRAAEWNETMLMVEYADEYDKA
jgi:pyruvate dehydrogenase E1 component beta subunit